MRTYWTIFMIASLATAQENQPKTFIPDLGNVVNNKDWRILNRNVSQVNDQGKKVVQFDERQGGGLAFLQDFKFENGAIEFDVKGKNVFQKSFVGIAFHGIDDNSFDAVYFRPFNFKAEDSTRRVHAVQYVSSPDCGWKVLREKYQGKYGQPVQPVPNPDAWFLARVEIDYPNVSVFVNESSKPCLVVQQLNDRKTGWVGLFVGEGSDGSFANLKITPKK